MRRSLHANRLNAIARESSERFFSRYGGKISSEWFFPKVWQILEEAPEIYEAADRMIEAADWVIWQLTGVETRNVCTAGYKAIWSSGRGFRAGSFLRPWTRTGDIVEEKMSRDASYAGARAGGLRRGWREKLGLRRARRWRWPMWTPTWRCLRPRWSSPDKMVMVMGTSICHMVLGERELEVEGMCGVVEDGILPGYYGYEAGQSAVGDIFGWFVETCVPEAYAEEAAGGG